MKLKNCKPGVRVVIKEHAAAYGASAYVGLQGEIVEIDEYEVEYDLPSVLVRLDGLHEGGGDDGKRYFYPQELRRLTPKVGDRVRVKHGPTSYPERKGLVVRETGVAPWSLAVQFGEEDFPLALPFAPDELERIR